ncbi:MAG: hypothetical protein AAGG11_11455 [Pseudomonadota bacterium]
MDILRNGIVLGWYDFFLAYRRTFLGPIWQSLQIALWSAGLVFVFGTIYEEIGAYVAYLVPGLAVWNCLSNTVTQGTSVFTSRASIILNLPAGLMLHVVRLTTTTLIRFTFQLAVFIPIVVYFNLWPEVLWGHALLGTLFLAALIAPVIVVVGILNAYQRDLEQLISVVMRFMFFLTPVFWMPAEGSFQMRFVDWNPFFYPLTIVRSPLLGESVALQDWALGLTGFLVLTGCATTMFALSAKRLPTWL